MDLAVKGNTLYADLYTDLVAIDITDPHHVALKKVIEGVFPDRYYGIVFTADTSEVIASWEKRDTTVTENGRIGLEKNRGIIAYAPGQLKICFRRHHLPQLHHHHMGREVLWQGLP